MWGRAAYETRLSRRSCSIRQRGDLLSSPRTSSPPFPHPCPFSAQALWGHGGITDRPSDALFRYPLLLVLIVILCRFHKPAFWLAILCEEVRLVSVSSSRKRTLVGHRDDISCGPGSWLKHGMIVAEGCLAVVKGVGWGVEPVGGGEHHLHPPSRNIN